MNEWIDVFRYAANSMIAIREIHVAMGWNMKSKTSDTMRNIFNWFNQLLLVLRSGASLVKTDERNQYLDKINFDFQLQEIDDPSIRNINTCLRMLRTDQRVRLDKAKGLESASIALSMVIKNNASKDFIDDLIKKHKPDEMINDITKYEISFNRHYFKIEFDGNGCYCIRSGKMITLYVSDFKNAILRYTIAGRAYKLQI